MTTLPTTIQDRMAMPALPRPTSPEGGLGGLTATDIMAMLRRRMVLIFVLFFLFAGLAVAGFLLWYFRFPGYRAESLIECITNIPETELTAEQQRMREDEHERFVQTQAMLIKSPSILVETLKVNAVRETNWYKQIEASSKKPLFLKKEPLLELEKDLAAAPVRGTNFLQVAIECHDPDDPAVIVNNVVARWYEEVKKRSAEEFAGDPLEALQRDADSIESEIRSKRERLKALAARMPAGAREDPGNNITAHTVRQYAEQVAVGTLELSQLDQYRSVFNSPGGVAVTAEDRALVEADPQVYQLSQVVFLLQQQRAADARTYGEGHVEIKRMDAQIEEAEKTLASKRMELLSQRQADMRDAANTAYENSRHALFVSQENLAKAEAELQDQDRLLFEYTDLEEQLERDLEYFDKIQERVRGLDRVKNQRTAVRLNVAQPAITPLKRSSPSLILLPFGIVLAMALAGGIGLTAELLDKSVRTTQDITRHLDVAMLGMIPDTDEEEIRIKKVETAVRDVPRSMVAEAFRRIRTNLQFAAPADRQRTILVTSPVPQDGKTTVACNLAMVQAQSGRRVLLIDANLRRPEVHRVFEGVSQQGLSNVLVGEGTLASCVSRTKIPNMDVLGSGPLPPNPVDLLTGPKWLELLREAQAQYDQIIIDTPPVLLASDAGVLATTVDGVILVVRANRNSRGVAKRACMVLTHVNAHMFGAVLNAARVTRGGYFREQARAFYDYQPEEDRRGRRIAKT